MAKIPKTDILAPSSILKVSTEDDEAQVTAPELW